jgi:hypothetical protein
MRQYIHIFFSRSFWKQYWCFKLPDYSITFPVKEMKKLVGVMKKNYSFFFSFSPHESYWYIKYFKKMILPASVYRMVYQSKCKLEDKRVSEIHPESITGILNSQNLIILSLLYLFLWHIQNSESC